RRPGQGGRHRGEAGEAEVALRGHRPVLLRSAGGGNRLEAQAFGARRARDHRRQPRVSRARGARGDRDGPRHGLARHRHARSADGSVVFHRDHRAPAGSKDRLPGRDCLSHEVHRRRAARGAGETARGKRLRRVPAPRAHRPAATVKVVQTELPGVLLLEPRVYQDERGFFLESYNRRTFRDATGNDIDFVQDNQVFSVRNVLRGLHYQIRQPQGKLVAVLAGEIFDVAVDLRRSSPTFGKWLGTTLTGGSHRMIWVPAGFAHGYLVLSEHAIVMYKTTDFYAPAQERT